MANAMLLHLEDYAAGTARDTSPGQIPATLREVSELIYVAEGSADYWVEDQFYRLQVGDILLLPAGSMVGATLRPKGCPFWRHNLWMSRRYSTFLTLQDEQADYAFAFAKEQGRFLLRLPDEEREELETLFERIVLECQADAFNTELSAKALLSTLLVQINRLLAKDANCLLLGSAHRLTPVLSHIHAHCTDSLTVEALARQFNFSPSHLAHSFKKHTGTSLYHYIVQRRLEIGRQAMMDGVPVKEAYQLCGFGDYAGFYRAFLKEYGLSPQQYKKKNQ